MENFDVVVIGGGPGGYVAAVRASQLGFKTALVEKESLGGTCLNWGCIPTKSLLRNAEIVNLLSKGRTYGFSFDNLSVDYGAAHKRSRKVVSRQTKRIAFLLKNFNITHFVGSAKLSNNQEVVIEPTGQKISAKSIILATGAKSRQLPGVPFDGKAVINSTNALNLDTVPSSVVIVGAGPIGMEFATLWNQYSSKVTVVEMMDHVLPLEDEDISVEAEKQFKRKGITVKTGAAVTEVKPTSEGVSVSVNTTNKQETISAETVLVSIGFIANSENLGLESVGVNTTNGNIDVDEQMRTNIPNIYAIGDVNGKMGLAHVASAQGMIAAEAIASKETLPLTYTDIPRCTYSSPEVASVGLTEKQAREQGYSVVTSQCPFLANGKAIAMDENSGFVKIIAEEKDKKILGVHFIGGHVTELIAGPAGMIQANLGYEHLAETVHAHPTISEAIMEAAHKLCGHAIHI